MTRTIDLAVIAGDGIGPEVVAEGLKALNAVLEGSDVVVEQTAYDLGAQRWHATGDTLTDEDLESIKKHDAILRGAILTTRPRQSATGVGRTTAGSRNAAARRRSSTLG